MNNKKALVVSEDVTAALYEALSNCASMIRHAVGADVFVDPNHTMSLADVTAILSLARGESIGGEG